MELFVERLCGEVDLLEWETVEEKDYGYLVCCCGMMEGCCWEMELKFFYSQLEIRYVIIQYFQVAIERCGYGTKLFQSLLNALKVFEHLEMIRLEANDEIGRKFWMKKNGFRLKGENYDEIKGNSCWFDLDCEYKVKELYLHRYIYDLKRCSCPSCQLYYKENY